MRSSRGGSRAAPALLLALALGCAHAAPTTSPQPNPRAARTLAADLDRIFGSPLTAHALWGVQIKSLDSGRLLYSRNAATLMMPASNMKIVTLAAAAETLGWDYRFKTTLETTGSIEDGVLKGDLIVRGTGDPTINTRNNRAAAVFDEWAAALRAAGVTRIDGGVVGDATAFDDRRLGQGWAWDYLEAGYAAPVGALEYNENIAAVRIRPGAKPGDAAELELPPGTGLGLLYHVVTGTPGSRTAITLERRTYDNYLDVSGTIAADAAPLSRDVAVVTPTKYFAHSLLLGLRDRGIVVDRLPVDVMERPADAMVLPRRVLHESLSPPLREIATTMMKVSQNLYAETLLKAVGAAKEETGTAAAGRRAASSVFSAWGIDDSSYVQADGSGLSRYDYVTPAAIVTLLERLHADPKHRDAFVATLPIAGTDGTIATRLRATRAEANATAKTGSISNARALSGYVRTRDGELLAFSILANNFTVPAATINWMTDLAVETLANHTSRIPDP
jgi:D-alanyl-D-alanine carboxypeptidase/D-alanyl-D-alanine-endopeptidase (penicillin-binding protein 4)